MLLKLSTDYDGFQESDPLHQGGTLVLLLLALLGPSCHLDQHPCQTLSGLLTVFLKVVR